MGITYIILLLVIGGIIGWLASIVMRTDGQQGIFLNIVVGIVGSFIGNGLLHLFPTSSTGSIATLSDWRSWLAAFVGAVILLAILNLINRGRVR